MLTDMNRNKIISLPLLLSSLSLILSSAVLAENPQTSAPPAPKETEMGHIGYLDHKNSFAGFVFGSSIGDYTEVTERVDQFSFDPRIKYYLVVKAPKNTEGFWEGGTAIVAEGKIAGVSLEIKDEKKSQLFRKLIEMAYGQGLLVSPQSQNVKWGGKVVNCSISYGEQGVLFFQIFSNQMQEKISEWERSYYVSVAQSL